MDNWKYIGAILSGVAALITAFIPIVSYLSDIQKDNVSNIKSISSHRESNLQFGLVSDMDGHANLRDNPSTSANIITIIPNNSRLEIIKRYGNWYQVKTKDERIGFIYYDRLQLQYEN